MDKRKKRRRRVALITGATGAIGKAIARQIASKDGYEVVLAVRNEEKAQRAVSDIKGATGNDHVRYELVDVSRSAAIRALAERWPGPLDVLVNNAATTPRRRQETPEGIELQFATHVLGYFWMTYAFTDVLKASAPARVVNVASYWAGDLDLGDLEFERRRYSNGMTYRQSKQTNRADGGLPEPSIHESLGSVDLYTILWQFAFGHRLRSVYDCVGSQARCLI